MIYLFRPIGGRRSSKVGILIGIRNSLSGSHPKVNKTYSRMTLFATLFLSLDQSGDGKTKLNEKLGY